MKSEWWLLVVMALLAIVMVVANSWQEIHHPCIRWETRIVHEPEDHTGSALWLATGEPAYIGADHDARDVRVTECVARKP